MEQLCSNETSTTHLLERISSSRLRVNPLCQVLTQEGNIERKVTLSILPGQPLLYCESLIFGSSLHLQEKETLMNGCIPIGRIFANSSVQHPISKKNIKVDKIYDTLKQDRLKVTNVELTQKSYDFWVGDRFIARISEYFSRESLQRLALISFYTNTDVAKQ